MDGSAPQIALWIEKLDACARRFESLAASFPIDTVDFQSERGDDGKLRPAWPPSFLVSYTLTTRNTSVDCEGTAEIAAEVLEQAGLLKRGISEPISKAFLEWTAWAARQRRLVRFGQTAFAIGPIESMTPDEAHASALERLRTHREEFVATAAPQLCNGPESYANIALALRVAIAELRQRAAELGARETATAPSSANVVTPLIDVNLEKRTLTLRGKTFSVMSVQALRWVAVLASRWGQWISGPECRQHDEQLLEIRTHKLRPHLPDEVRDLIESKAGTGSRLQPLDNRA